MSALRLRVVLVAAFVVAAAGAAVALSSFDGLAGSGLDPSGAPGLLGPITENGRTGWDCAAEKAATAQRWRDATLPPP